MNRILHFASILFFALAVAACGGGGDVSSPATTTDPGGSEPSQQTGTPPPEESSPSEPSQPATPPPPEGDSSFSHDVQLSWTAPDSRENGDPLLMSDLSGYYIYYLHEDDMDSSGNGTSTWVEGGDTSSTTITVNAPGTWYFAIAAVDADGLTSSLSNHVGVAVN